MTVELRQVDRIEILTLQDNFIDIAAHDGTDVVRRAAPEDAAGNRLSVLAEHGFSAAISLTVGAGTHRALFDFGFSHDGALRNARLLGVDLAAIDVLVLSHGHIDHHGGLPAIVEARGGSDIELVTHPGAFRPGRYVRLPDDRRLPLPPPDRGRLEQAGVRVVHRVEPTLLLDDTLLFLGQIPRRTDFETGMAAARYEEGGVESHDRIEDDSAVVAHLRGKGLLVLSGCAHAGIVNTVTYAREVTGVGEVFAVMGGFHLTGAGMDDTIARTARALEELGPRYIVPTHCTGRAASAYLERTMPASFLLNMSGTTLVFAA